MYTILYYVYLRSIVTFQPLALSVDLLPYCRGWSTCSRSIFPLHWICSRYMWSGIVLAVLYQVWIYGKLHWVSTYCYISVFQLKLF